MATPYLLHILTLVSLWSTACSTNTSNEPASETNSSYTIGSEKLVTLAGKEKHEYALRGLVEGQFVGLFVDQLSMDVRISLVAGERQPGFRVSVPGNIGQESIEWLVNTADTTDELVLRIETAWPGASGQYRIRSVMRSPTLNDKMRLRGLASLYEGFEGYQAGQEWSANLELFQRAETEFEAAGDKRNHGLALVNQLSMLDLLGRNREGKSCGLKSRAIYEGIGDLAGVARSCFGLGRVHASLGEIEAAEKALECAIRNSKAIDDKRTQAKAIHNLGELYKDLGEFQNAFDTMTQSLAIMEELESEHLVAIELQALGELSMLLGDIEDARRKLERAVAELNRLRYLWDEGRAVLALAKLHANALEEPEKALVLVSKALALSTEAKDERGRMGSLELLGKLEREAGRPTRSHAHLIEALQIATSSKEPFEEAEIRLELGRSYLASGDVDQAIGVLNLALSQAQTYRLKLVEAAAKSALAEVEIRRGNLDTARVHSQHAIDVAEGMRTGLRRPSMRTTYAAVTRSLYNRHIDILMRSPTGQRQAFLASERSRARMLLESLEAKSNQGVREPCTQAELQSRSRRSLALRLAEKANRRVLAGTPTKEEKENSEDHLAKAVRAYDEQCGLQTASQAVTLSIEQIQERLPVGALLLEFAITESNVHVWTVTQKSFRAQTLPIAEEVESLAETLYSALASRNASSLLVDPAKRKAHIRVADARAQITAQTLTEMLLAPALAGMRPRELFVVSDQSLHYLPFAALPSPTNSQRLLVDDFEIRTLPSASTLRVRSPQPKKPAKITVIADPVFSKSDSRLHSPLPPTAKSFSRLRFSRMEAEAIVALAPSTSVHTDFQAQASLLRGDALAGTSILHLATHGVVNSRYPELGHLVFSLTDDAGSERPGLLRLHEIYQLTLPIPLVVLSACESAIGASIRGEGLQGLTRGFLFAGAGEVVASMWQVHDRASAAFMGHFYKAILQGNASTSKALHMAQMALRSDPRWSAPYYWAAYTLHGAP